MPTYNLFGTTVPVVPDASDGTPISLHTLWSSLVAGTVTHIRWRFPNTLPGGPVVGALFSRTNEGVGVELARATFAAPVAGAWNQVALPAPVPVTANTWYYTSVHTPDRYVATVAYFNSAAYTTGPITAPADDTVTPRRNGRFAANAVLTYPDNQFNGSNYFADLVFNVPGGVVADPQHYVMAADVERTFTLEANYNQVEVVQVANPAVLYFNTKDVAVPTTAGAVGTMDGNHVIPAVLAAKVVRDETSGGVSKVRVRTAGTPTISVRGM